MPNMKFFTYLKNVKGELSHVVWPSKKTAISHTVLVVLLSAFAAVFIAFLDYVFTGVVTRLITGA
jgi:preprotein translocase SecE subunit